MALDLTTIGQQLLENNEITPQIVVEFEGVDTIYSAVLVQEYWRIGDEGRTIGEAGLTIGGQVAIDNQENLISWSAGTSNSIEQVLNPDKGTNESVSTLRIALLDKSLKATKLVTPGEVVEDLLGVKAKVWIGEANSSWKDDYVIVFRGIVDDIDLKSGVVIINLSSPETLQNKTTFLPGETELSAAIDDMVTTIPVDSTADFLEQFAAPGGVDTNIHFYIRIDDEIIEYTTVDGTNFLGASRGALGTTAAAHDIDATVDSFYRITGNAIDIALKFMLSGQEDPYIEDFNIKSFQIITATETVANAIFLADFDIQREKNITIGDYVTVTGATEAANNFTNRQITDIVLSDVGYYIVVDGAALEDEATTSAIMSIESQYNVWPVGAGVGLLPEEVDIQEHLNVRTKFLSSAEYDFYIKEEIESGKDFLSEQVYNPVSAYAIPRKAASSVAYNIGPIPGVEMKTLNDQNVIDASKLSIKRSTNKNFFNTIIYKFEEEVLEDEFKRGTVFIDGTSVSRIPVGNKALTIESKGLRELLSAVNIAQQASARRLQRYKFGAEVIRGLKTNFATGFDVEIGDKIVVELTNLQVSDIKTGTRSGEPRIFEIINKKLNIRKGFVTLDLLDTNFDLTQRFALIGPSSRIKTGSSGTEFIIEPTFNTSRFGSAEWKKWDRFRDSEVLVRSPDFSVQGTALINRVTSNNITLQSDLGFTPLAGYIMEASNYSDQTSDVKLVYGFMSDDDNDFADGKVTYKQS